MYIFKVFIPNAAIIPGVKALQSISQHRQTHMAGFPRSRRAKVPETTLRFQLDFVRLLTVLVTILRFQPSLSHQSTFVSIHSISLSWFFWSCILLFSVVLFCLVLWCPVPVGSVKV